MTTRRRSRLELFFIGLNAALRDRSDTYLARRPHRSFRWTRRRDYARSFALPGYVGLIRETVSDLWTNRRLFGSFFIVYTASSAIILGVISQTNYAAITQDLRTATPDLPLRTLALFGTAITGGLNPAVSANAGVVSGLLVVLAWLVLVWMFRHVASGSKVALRDGLYNAGAPLIPTVLVALAGIAQCIPIIIVTAGYAAASATGLLSNGIEAMLFFGAAALLVTLSLYWLTSTFIALIVVTLPGMRPWSALRAAGDLSVGRRFRLIVRLVCLGIFILLVWAVVLIPIILLDNLFMVAWLPLVPLAVLGLTTVTLIVTSGYIYRMYRYLVDDESEPA